MSKPKLQKREKAVLAIGAALLVIALGYHLGQKPLAEYEQSQLEVQRARTRLEEARLWREEVTIERAGQEELQRRIKARGRRFDLLTYVQGALDAAKLQDRSSLDSRRSVIAPRDLAQVELALRGVSLEELVGLLHRIYAGENLVVLYKLTHIRPERDGKGLICKITFLAPRSQQT